MLWHFGSGVQLRAGGDGSVTEAPRAINVLIYPISVMPDLIRHPPFFFGVNGLKKVDPGSSPG
jgi:hypothetical protein